MKNQVLTSLFILFLSAKLTAQIAINETNTPPNPTSILDVNSPTKGLLIPRMTAAQKSANWQELYLLNINIHPRKPKKKLFEPYGEFCK